MKKDTADLMAYAMCAGAIFGFAALFVFGSIMIIEYHNDWIGWTPVLALWVGFPLLGFLVWLGDKKEGKHNVR